MPHHEGQEGFGRYRAHPSDIRQGYEVYSADDKKVCEIDEVSSNYFHCSKGFLFTKDVYIPYDTVTRVENRKVFLDVAGDRVDQMGWDQPMAGEAGMTGGYREGAEERRIPVREEELAARKTVEPAGEVEVRKNVTEEQKTMEIPRVREDVTVERQRVERPSEGPVGEGETIRVPITEERIEIEKRPVVKEELVIKKQPEVAQERVTETVKKEQAEVERRGEAKWGEGGSGATRPGYETAASRPGYESGATRFSYRDIRPGTDVYCADNKKLGSVTDVAPDYIHVEKGFLFTKDIYIPQSAISNFDGNRVYLNVGCDRIDSMNWWDRPPTRGPNLGA
jgi:uncharacterized protein (TIGR02271 family)